MTRQAPISLMSTAGLMCCMNAASLPLARRHMEAHAALLFKARAEEAGFKQAVAERDSGKPIPGSKK